MKELALPQAWKERALVIAGLNPPAEWFSNAEEEIVASFRLPRRREEWRLSRMAAKTLAMRRGICPDPRSCVIEERKIGPWFVSLSHSSGHAGAAIDSAPIGIDVEVVRPIKEAAAHLFLTDDEAETMRRCSISDRLIHFWAAKEAAWKQGGGVIETLKRVPLRLEEETPDGLRFDLAESVRVGEVIVALTRPTV